MDEAEVRAMLSRNKHVKVLKGSLTSRFDPYGLSKKRHKQPSGASTAENVVFIESANKNENRAVSARNMGIPDEVEFFIPGDAVPKGRPRIAGKVAYTPKRTIDYERKVRVVASIAMIGREPFEFSVSISVEVYQKNRRRSDLDNILKAILDACNGVVYGDDSQIDEIHIIRVRDEEPRVKVTVSGRRVADAV